MGVSKIEPGKTRILGLKTRRSSTPREKQY